MKEHIIDITDSLKIINILNKLKFNKTQFWSWQKKDKERNLQFLSIQMIDFYKKTITVTPFYSDKVEISFIKNKPIYLCDKKLGYTFKSEIQYIENHFMILKYPQMINIAKNDLVDKIEIIEKENEESHIHERAHERKQPQSFQFIEVKKNDSSKINFCQLHDLSQGGLSFITDIPSLFSKGEEIKIRISEKPITGIVTSTKELPNQYNSFKVGVQFSKK